MNYKAKDAKETIRNYLSKIEGLSHLNVGTRGALLTITSKDEEGNVYPHARLRRRTVNKWGLEMPVKRGWEWTFMEGTHVELIQLLLEKFSWALAPR